MSTTTTLVLTGGIVYAGRLAEDKDVSMRIVLGASFVALVLAAMGDAANGLASKMALLILLGAFFRYSLPILKKAGLV